MPHRLTVFPTLAAVLFLIAPPSAAPQGQACAATPPADQREAARLNNIGTALINQQLLDRAAETFAKAYATDPALTLAKTNEAVALLYLQRIPEAHKALDIALAANPADPHSWCALGLLDRNENQPRQALAAFNKLIALEPNDADAHALAASIELDLGDFPAATAGFRAALALNPNHASAEFGLARSLQRQGDTAAAHAAFLQFQHITTAKLGSPFSHTYGEEGHYARVEDAAPAPSPVAPMIPVTFAESWRSPATTAPKPPNQAAAAPCLITLADDTAPTLILLNSGPDPVRLYRPTAQGFTLIPASETGLPTTGTALACAVGDFDNDGLPDLALAITQNIGQSGVDHIFLYKNLGPGSPTQPRFQDVTPASGITPTNHPTSLTFLDFDHDGDLDLFLTGTPSSVLWRNNGNGTFTNWTAESGLAGSTPTTFAVPSDLNNDRAIDLLVTGATPAPTFFANHREGPFAAAPLFAANLPPTTSAAIFDFNKDGFMDVLLTHAAGPDGVTLWRNLDGAHYERVPLPLPAATRGIAAVPIDFDNDGWIDLAVLLETSTGPQLHILRNLGPAGFRDVSPQLHLDTLRLTAPTSLLAADLARTGAPGLLLTQSDGTAILLANRGGSRNHVLALTLKGLADNKSGIGTKIEVFANGLWQKFESTGQPEILAGLGSATSADLVRLLWPTGVPQDEIDLPAQGTNSTATLTSAAGQPHTLTEIDRRGSSCPTLFAWDGARYAFISDVIGAAVVGHWTSPTQHNIPDPDEWIKIDGAKLHPHNGSLSLRFGEPMEEVNFVDQVRLVAIDHPAATAVYPNEGFLSEPPFAQARTIAVTAPRTLAGAWDNNGKDVLPILDAPLASQDPTYIRDFTNLPYAGFANLHSLTLDLGDPKARDTTAPLRLLLHGFIEYFSASSMYSAWQAGLAPIPPYVEAQLPAAPGEKEGSWKKIVPDMGFPAGLPRTVVVNLTGKLPPGAHRIRITTNLQIYWDHAEFDATKSATQTGHPAFTTTELPLARATLAFRGYPQQIDGHTPGDLTYNYQRISATGPFVPHRGAYTRYGDVTPLLTRVDDQYVIFGTGEDMDLEFPTAALPPLPAGWTRDFFFYANGFVKDMDFYEASPFQVGQLPFHGMSTYPYPAAEHYPDDPAHTAYQLNYNTRFESGDPNRSFHFNYQPRPAQPIP